MSVLPRLAVIVALSFASLVCVVAKAGNRHAFLIGVGQYTTSDLQPLKYAENDVTRLADVLRQVGYVPATNLIGKGEARFFSIKDNIPPWQVWQWPANVRWDRMFQSVYTPIDRTPT